MAEFRVQGEGVVVRKGVEDSGGVLALFGCEDTRGLTETVHE